MSELNEVATTIAEMIEERGFECGCRFEDIELVLQAFAHLGLRDFEVKDNIFNKNKEIPESAECYAGCDDPNCPYTH